MWNQFKYTDTFYKDDVHGQFAFGLPQDGSADQARLTDQWMPGTQPPLIDRIVWPGGWYGWGTSTPSPATRSPGTSKKRAQAVAEGREG